MAIPILVGVGVGAAVTGLQYNGFQNIAGDVASFVVFISQKYQFEGTAYEDKLQLSEALTLIWHEDDTKDLGLPKQDTRAVVLLGAIILDLIALKRVRIEQVEKKKNYSYQLVVNDATPVGAQHIDGFFLKVVKSTKPKSVKKWLTSEQVALTSMNADAFKNGEEVLMNFVQKGIMEKHEVKKMKVMNQTTFKLLSVDLRENLKIRLRRVVLESQPAYGHTMALLGLLLASDQFSTGSLLPKVFFDHELTYARHNLLVLIAPPPKKDSSNHQTPTTPKKTPTLVERVTSATSPRTPKSKEKKNEEKQKS